MALDNIFGIAGSALNAQTVRMNATASNRAVFKTILDGQLGGLDQSAKGGVKVTSIVDDPKPVTRQSDPGNPAADKDGYVYMSNVNEMSEMVDMMAAARSYQNNVEVVNTARQLTMRTLDIIKA